MSSVRRTFLQCWFHLHKNDLLKPCWIITNRFGDSLINHGLSMSAFPSVCSKLCIIYWILSPDKWFGLSIFVWFSKFKRTLFMFDAPNCADAMHSSASRGHVKHDSGLRGHIKLSHNLRWHLWHFVIGVGTNICWIQYFSLAYSRRHLSNVIPGRKEKRPKPSP